MPWHRRGGRRRAIANLNDDDDWLWGGTLDDIYQHHRAMASARTIPTPRYSADAALCRHRSPVAQIEAVANYVLSLVRRSRTMRRLRGRGRGHLQRADQLRELPRRGWHRRPDPRRAEAHRRDLRSRPATLNEIVAQVENPKHGVMPAWSGRLSDTVIKELALYVHSLGGGEAAAE